MIKNQFKVWVIQLSIIGLALLLQFCTTQKPVTKRPHSKTKSQKIDSISAEVTADTISVDKASPFVDGFARVIKDSSSFYIDKTGRPAFDFIADSFHPLDSVTTARRGYVRLHENEKKRMLLVVKDGLYGMTNEQGEWVLKPEYTSLSFEFKRYVEVHKNGNMTYADSWGNFLVPLKFEDVGILDGTYYDVKRNGKWGIYNASEDKMVIPFEYDAFDYCGGCSHKSDYVYAEKNGKWGIVGFNKKVLVPFEYAHQHAGMRSGDWVTAFKKNGHNVVINIPMQKEYGPPEYTSVQLIGDLLAAKKNGKYGLMDVNGKQIVDFIYDDVGNPYGSFESGPYMWVTKNSRYGIIDGSGHTVIPVEYKNWLIPRGSYFVFEKNDKKGLIDAENRVILPAEYEWIEQKKISIDKNHEATIFELGSEGKNGFYFPKTSKLVQPTFDGITFYNKKQVNPYGVHPVGLMGVEINDKDKLYDLNADRIIPGDYAKFEFQPHDKVVLVKENYGKQGLYDLNRKKLIIPFNYKFIKVFKEESTLIKVEKDAGDYRTHAGIFDSNGKQLLPVEFADIKSLDTNNFLLNKSDSLYSIWNSKTRKKERLPFAKVTKNDSTHLLTVKKDSSNFLYDYQQKKLLLKKGYADISQLENAFFVVIQKDSATHYTYGYANSKGKLMVPVKYDTNPNEYLTKFQNKDYLPLYKFKPGKSRFISNDYKGYADFKGKVLVPPTHKKVYPELNNHGFLTVNDNHFGVIDANGNEILAPKYNVVLNQALSPYKNTAEFNFPVLFGKEDRWQYINKDGNILPVKAHGYISFRKRRRY